MNEEMIEIEDLLKLSSSKQVGKVFSFKGERLGFVSSIGGKRTNFQIFNPNDVNKVSDALKELGTLFYTVTWDQSSIRIKDFQERP